MKIKRCHKPGPICVSQPKAICFWGREKKSCQGPSGAGGGDCRGADAEEKSSSDAQKRVVKYLSPHARTPRDRDLPAELSSPSPSPMASQSSTPAEAATPSPVAASTGEAAPSAASETPAQNPTAAATAAAGGTDLEKKMRRAERFGTQVVMSEEEKRSSRAER